MTVTSFSPVRYDVIRLRGGLDQVTPSLQLAPGAITDGKNFEVSTFGGYSRVEGYERFDGQQAPSRAQFGVVSVTLTGAVAAGQTVTNPVTAASGYVVDVVENALLLTKIVGALNAGDSLFVGPTQVGVVTSTPAPTLSAADIAKYSSLAGDAYRQDINPVPGIGPVRGVIFLNDTLYAFRDTASGTAGAVYRSSPNGWLPVPLGFQIGFNTGSVMVVEGQTVTGATSGATGVVSRVVLEKGAYLGSTAAGRFILSAISGTFSVGENLRVGATVVSKAASTASAITRLPGGKIETDIGSFTGASKTARVYGADGVNLAFEFDGTVYTQIRVGTAPVDAPSRVVVHQNTLFLAQQTSLFYSVVGNPYSFDATLFAGEIAVGQNITALKPQPGAQSSGALAVYTQNTTQILYGKSFSDFTLVFFNTGAGAYEYSAQNLASTYVFDQRGVVSLATAQSFGNFDSASVTLNLRPFIQANRASFSTSVLNRGKSQYRIFFANGNGLYCTFLNNQFAGAIPVQFPDPVNVICEGRSSSGNETSFFGSSNGFVYELESGTSFDGQEIDAQITLTYNPQGNSRLLKRYRKGSFEITGTGYAQFNFGYSLAYNSRQIVQPRSEAYELPFSAPFWDSFVWDSFVWDGVSLGPSEVEMSGTGENISIGVSSKSRSVSAFTLNSLILHYSARRALR